MSDREGPVDWTWGGERRSTPARGEAAVCSIDEAVDLSDVQALIGRAERAEESDARARRALRDLTAYVENHTALSLNARQETIDRRKKALDAARAVLSENR